MNWAINLVCSRYDINPLGLQSASTAIFFSLSKRNCMVEEATLITSSSLPSHFRLTSSPISHHFHLSVSYSCILLRDSMIITNFCSSFQYTNILYLNFSKRYLILRNHLIKEVKLPNVFNGNQQETKMKCLVFRAKKVVFGKQNSLKGMLS